MHTSATLMRSIVVLLGVLRGTPACERSKCRNSTICIVDAPPIDAEPDAASASVTGR